MTQSFFEHPILNSPYARPTRHWELDKDGQPTQKLVEARRLASYLTPIPKPKRQGSKQNSKAKQAELAFKDQAGISTDRQAYDPTPLINELRGKIDRWRSLPSPNDWGVTPATARLLEHWRRQCCKATQPFFATAYESALRCSHNYQ